MAEKIHPPRNISRSIQDNPNTENHKKLRSLPSTTSSESGFDAQDTVDAVPYRMPLIYGGEDYIKHAQASVENLIPSTRMYDSMPRPKRTYEGKYYLPRDSSHSKPKSGSGIHHGAEVGHVCYDKNDPNTHPTVSHNLNGNSKSNGTNSYQGQIDESNHVETDLGPSRILKPSLKDVKKSIGQHSNEESGNEATSPSQVNSSETQEEAQNQCCCSLGCHTFRAMFNWKYMFSKFSAWDCCLSLFSFGVYIFDVVTDLLLVLWYYYYRDQDPAYLLFFRLTLAFVVGPSLVVQIFSYMWVIDDFRNKKARERSADKNDEKKPSGMKARHLFMLIFFAILHIFQLATLFRYVRVLIYGFKSRYYEVKKMKEHQEHYDSLWKSENQDVNMLRFLESFLESAPQLVLQLYIMLTKTVEIINVVSCVGSLIGASTAMVSIQRAIRNTNPSKNQLTIPASFVMFVWRACTVSSRVLAFSLFLTIQPLVLLLFVILHWFAAAIWIVWKGTNFCSKKAAEIFFDFVIGFVYTFCFFNVHEEKPDERSRVRIRMLVFYIIMLIENSTLSIIWFFFRDNPVVFFSSDNPIDSTQGRNESTTSVALSLESDRIFPRPEALQLVVMVHGLFFFGMVFMLLYYGLCHPKKNPSTCHCCCKRLSGSDSVEVKDTSNVSQCGSEPNTMTQNLCLTAEPESQLAAEETGINQGLHNSRVYSESRKRDAGKDKPRSASPHRNWDDIFNRGKRAEKLYTRQYSKEKHQDNRDKTSQPMKISGKNSGAETISMKSYPKQEASIQNKGDESGSSEFSANCDKKSTSLSNENASCGEYRSHTNNNSNLPGSRHHYGGSASLPKNSRRRGYSASMSCLVEGNYGLFSDKRFRNRALNAPRYTLNADEVLECMETAL